MFEHVLEQRAEDWWSWRTGRREWLIGTVLFGLGLLLLVYPLLVGIPSRSLVGILAIIFMGLGFVFQGWGMFRRYGILRNGGSEREEKDPKGRKP